MDQPSCFVVNVGEVRSVDLEDRQRASRESKAESRLGTGRTRPPAGQFVREIFESRVVRHDEHPTRIPHKGDVVEQRPGSRKVEFFRELEPGKILKTLAQALEGRSGSPGGRAEYSIRHEAPVPEVLPHPGGRFLAARTQRAIEIPHAGSSRGGVRVPQESQVEHSPNSRAPNAGPASGDRVNASMVASRRGGGAVFCEATRHLTKVEPRLGVVIREVGPHRLAPRRGRYAALCRSIVGQQLSTKAANTIYSRFKSACGGWVTPTRVSSLSDFELRGVGFSRSKVASVRDLTRALEQGDLRLDRLGKLDNEGVAAELLPIRGIGPWSVDMFLMFVLARPDVLPVGDLGIQNALARMHRLRKRPDPKRMLALTHAWKPYRSIGSWYLWRGLETDLL